MPEEKKKLRNYFYPYVFLFGILVAMFFLCFSARVSEKRSREDAYQMLELYGVRAESLLNSLFHKTDILESVIITNRGELDDETFNNLASTLLDGKGIRAIQCLPKGVVTYCYPLEGNESTIGSNIFEMPERKEDARLALQTKQIALSGPYDLTQGGFGLVARNPIFLEAADGTEEFWGFSVVVLGLPEALEPLMLSVMPASGYEYQISCEVNGKYVIVDQSFTAGSDNSEKLLKRLSGNGGKDYIAVDVNVPNHVWQLKLVPEHGWADKKLLAFQGIISILFTLLGTAIVYLLERQGMQMRQYATTDELTGLFNRRRLKEYMDIRCRDKDIMFSMFYLDLDRFKAINDTGGHACGDAVLKESGQRIKRALGKEGSVYRVGGDEFIAIMEVSGSEESCVNMKKRIQDAIAEPFTYENHPVDMSASIGYAVFPDEGQNLEELMNLGDKRMYQNKK